MQSRTTFDTQTKIALFPNFKLKHFAPSQYSSVTTRRDFYVHPHILSYLINWYNAHFSEIFSNTKVIPFTKETNNEEMLSNVIVTFDFEDVAVIAFSFQWW